jgi:pyruvate-ferredoxin/flavodoxin oxidoreductase
LFGDRMIVANATGCSSIFGGNLPTTPWTCNADGRGPAWCNSLFEDNAEFGYGMRIAVDARTAEARHLLSDLRAVLDEFLVDGLLGAPQATEADIHDQRQRVETLRHALDWFLLAAGDRDSRAESARRLHASADYLVKKSVWLVGGDGWAYDIGYGGLDHVLASGANVNVLVLDTEVYSNTGGQASKATPRAAVARFAAAGKSAAKKDLGLLALTYRNVYVARIALGANDTQTVKAFLEAEAYDGPSLIIAYAHCIAHGVDMSQGLEQQSRAVASGHWPLFRYDPRRASQGARPFVLDSKAPSLDFAEFAAAETRFRRVTEAGGEALASAARDDITTRWRMYETLAQSLHV